MTLTCVKTLLSITTFDTATKFVIVFWRNFVAEKFKEFLEDVILGQLLGGRGHLMFMVEISFCSRKNA